MQFAKQAKQPVGVVFDSDMGERIDAALALALLFGLDGKNEARVAGICTTKCNLKAAAFCDAVARFYGGNSPFRVMPIGMTMEGTLAEDPPMFRQTVEKFTHSIKKLNDTAEPLPLIRNALTAQQDGNGIVVLAGPATNLAKLLDIPGAKDIVGRKVKLLAIAGGGFAADGPPEAHVKSDVAAAKRLFAEWPTPIVVSGQEVGAGVLFPASSIEKDFAWSTTHPIAEVYRAYKPMPYDAPAWDMTAVLYAIRPKEGYFKLSDPGRISVLDDGRTKFAADSGGKHRFLISDPAQNERILKAFTEIASAKPVPRVPRFRQQQQEQDKPKAAEPKPTDEKPAEVKSPV